MSHLERAIAIALEAHAAKKDRNGRPYILHPLHVMMDMDDEIEMIAAVLHDVVEDSDISLDDLRQEGFPTAALRAVELLTHDKENVPYMTYVRALKPDPIARKIKLADLQHNMTLTRLKKLSEKDQKRLEKYHAAWKILTE